MEVQSSLVESLLYTGLYRRCLGGFYLLSLPLHPLKIRALILLLPLYSCCFLYIHVNTAIRSNTPYYRRNKRLQRYIQDQNMRYFSHQVSSCTTVVLWIRTITEPSDYFINCMFYVKRQSISLKMVKLKPQMGIICSGRQMAVKNLSWNCSMSCRYIYTPVLHSL